MEAQLEFLTNHPHIQLEHQHSSLHTCTLPFSTHVIHTLPKTATGAASQNLVPQPPQRLITLRLSYLTSTFFPPPLPSVYHVSRESPEGVQEYHKKLPPAALQWTFPQNPITASPRYPSAKYHGPAEQSPGRINDLHLDRLSFASKLRAQFSIQQFPHRM